MSIQYNILKEKDNVPSGKSDSKAVNVLKEKNIEYSCSVCFEDNCKHWDVKIKTTIKKGLIIDDKKESILINCICGHSKEYDTLNITHECVNCKRIVSTKHKFNRFWCKPPTNKCMSCKYTGKKPLYQFDKCSYCCGKGVWGSYRCINCTSTGLVFKSETTIKCPDCRPIDSIPDIKDGLFF